MGEIIAFVFELIFRILLEALFEGIFYGLKKFWFWLTGQESKGTNAVITHQGAVQQRHLAIEQLRRKRSQRRKQKR